jgi:hypothetical protein
MLAGQNASEISQTPVSSQAIITSDKASLDCINEALGKGVLARVDEKQKRYFVIQKSVDIATLKPMIKKIEHCLPKDWVDQWSLSVFTMKELAGYQDETSIIPFHKNNKWAKGYLAEYDSKNREVTFSPTIKPRTVFIK